MSSSPVRYTAGELRARMPTIAAWIDEMRAAFGAETINEAIRAGIAGEPRFWASENGVEIGTKRPEPYGMCSADSYLRLIELERMASELDQ